MNKLEVLCGDKFLEVLFRKAKRKLQISLSFYFRRMKNTTW
jgi:hypothetical protein